jgi:hypothetical protein
MSRERDYTWYIEPLDPHTNQWIGRSLWEEIDGCRSVLCADGVSRDMWRCDRDFVEKLKRSRQQNRYKFKIFVQEGNGLARESWIDSKHKTANSN